MQKENTKMAVSQKKKKLRMLRAFAQFILIRGITGSHGFEF